MQPKVLRIQVRREIHRALQEGRQHLEILGIDAGGEGFDLVEYTRCAAFLEHPSGLEVIAGSIATQQGGGMKDKHLLAAQVA